ncbi:uncharacterized protein NPIL_316471 [Nephila pilipes]|uniref:Uncharacterized protein n=1 Tax=Nephila pilipes TaxID=299642 RepID=A0A8X6UN85_NEPPI|nr:uncharacterized protein NPIL_316471 [Nephila pilipes]
MMGKKMRVPANGINNGICREGQLRPRQNRRADVMASAETKDVKMAINGPIFFLIQEQAKSVVAIQALQTRMAVLESLQERLMQAIDDVHQHLASSKDTKSNPNSAKYSACYVSAKPSSNIAASSEKKLRFVETTGNNTITRPETVVSKSELSKSDSLNKDSGIGGSESDSSLAPTEPATNFPSEEDDELLQLLELIDQKSLVLLKQVGGEDVQNKGQLPPEMDDPMSNQLLDNLLFEKVDTQRQLSEVKAERDELRHRLAKLELATEAVTKQKLKVQQQLDATLVENKSLQEKIHKSSEFGRRTESLGYLADIERASIKRKYLEYSEKSRLKVSNILKEGNVLELQKQLLSYVMENDILRAKLQQDEPSKIAKWLKIESQLRKELKEVTEENQRLKEVFQSKDLEIASLKDKIRAMEEYGEDDSCVKNFGMGSNEDWREPGVQNLYNKRSNLNNNSPFSPLGYGDFSKTQSLPAILLLGAQNKLKEQDSMRANYDHVYDTGSFTDIPLNPSYPSGQAGDNSSHHSAFSKDLVDLTSPAEPSFSSTSTLVHSNYSNPPILHSGLSAPNLTDTRNHNAIQNWVFAPRKPSVAVSSAADLVSGAKLVNGHLCWKGTSKLSNSNCHLSVSEDISSICTEFDPLSDDNPSCENFVDSLNLSIPLKPTQVAISQLSSIGDSLHSNSLDNGCSSSPVMYQDTRKVSNARSVDGIRELLLENGYCKKLSSPQYGQSSVAPIVLGKSGRHLPVNIMNCMHERSDYSLL